MKKKIFVLNLLISSLIFSDEMTFQEMLTRLKSSNYEIKSQEKLIEIKELDINKNFKKIFPGLNLEIDTEILQNRKYKYSKNLGPQSIKAPILLYSGGRVINNYKKIKNIYGIEQQNLKLIELKEEIKAISLYFEVLNLSKQIEITKLAKETLEKQKSRLNILFKNNKMVSKNELLEVTADIMSINSEILRYENDKRAANEKLFVLLDMDLDSNIKLIEFKEKITNISDIDLKSDLRKANETGIQAKKKDLEIDNAKLDYKISKAEFMPTLTVTPRYILDSDIKYGNKNHNDWGIEVEASVNIFQWGATLNSINSSKKAVERREMEKNNTLKNLSTEIKSKHREINLLFMELKISKERLKLLEENQKIQNIRFRNGMLSSLDYLESVKLLRKAEEKSYGLKKEQILAFREYNNLIQ
ncbi:MAG: TolC family protein [Fusobacteriaceae bacterium]